MSGDFENSIEFRCSNCSKRLRAKQRLAGRRMRCPNCSAEISIPLLNGSTSGGNGALAGNGSAGNSSTILSSTDGLSEASAVDNPKANSDPNLVPVLAAAKPVESATRNLPRPNSFDVDDLNLENLQLESMAISDLEERQRTSEEIREEKNLKRRQQLAAEKRRREDFQARNASNAPVNASNNSPGNAPNNNPSKASTHRSSNASSDDEYNLLPAAPRPNPAQSYTLPSVPMLDEDLLPQLTSQPANPGKSASANSAASPTGPAQSGGAKSAGVSSSSQTPANGSSRPKPPQATPSASKPNANSNKLDDLDALAPELEDVPVIKNSLAFFDDVVEDKYRIACPICGTIQYVGVNARGSTAKCPDCYSKFTVPPPPANWTPSKIAARHNHFDTNAPLAASNDAQVVDRHRKQATSELLEKAEIDLESEKSDADRYGVEDFDTATFMRRTFGFLRDPVALGFIFGYSLVFALVFAMVQYGISHSEDGEVGKGSALFCVIVGPLIGLLFGLPMISAALAQLEAVANHQPKVVDWPGFDMFDNLGDLLCVAMALGMSAVPGFLIGLWLGGDAEGSGRIQLTGVMFSILLLFPIFLLSILDNGSLLQVVSRDVLRSMREVADAWASYYFKSALFIAVTLILWYLLLGKGKSAVLGAIAGATFPVVVFFLFQQVGSLADLISEHLSFSFAKSGDESESDQPEDLEDAV